MGKASFQSGFPTCNANPIDPAAKRLESAQHIFQWNGSVTLRVEDKRMIMAVRAAKIAARQKKDRAEFSWPIQKGGFQKSFDLGHGGGLSADRERLLEGGGGSVYERLSRRCSFTSWSVGTTPLQLITSLSASSSMMTEGVERIL